MQKNYHILTKTLSAYLLLVFILFALSILSCSKTLLNYEFPINENQVVTFASISPDSGVVVYLTKSYNPNGADIPTETDPLISGAEIFLYKSNILIDTLEEITTGKYRNTFSLDISPGDIYSIEVNYGEQIIISENVSILDTIVYSNPVFETEAEYDSLYQQWFLSFSVLLTDISAIKNYYGYSNAGLDYSGFLQTAIGYLYNYTAQFSANCLETEFTPSFEYEGIFTDKCFNGESFELKTKIALGYGDAPAAYSKIYILLNNYSQGYYDYLHQLFYSGFFDNGFSQYTSPYATYSNMSNGFGVFYAYNSITIEKDF